MVPFGISMAATVRVGHAAGRNDAHGVRRAGLMAMLLGLGLAVLFTLGIIAARFAIVQLFLGSGVADAAATVALAATLLLVGTTFFITDALQTITVGALRGIKDTRIPLLLAVLGYWLIGFPLSYVLGLHTPLSATGIWIGLSIGTGIYAAMLVLRFLRLSR
ncbi:MATE family efflux transporter, partial [Bradyrhizobium sp. STM 3809]|uniref:MATE family efflux transporter n=1 Tax=Bradyrhizobium sp. STM 3809 TaxID=551936 RepID=UPI00024082C1